MNGLNSNYQIVQTLSRQLSWSHLTEIIRQDDPFNRESYASRVFVGHETVD